MWGGSSCGEKAWVAAQDGGAKGICVDVVTLDAAFLGLEVETELMEIVAESAAFVGDLLEVGLGGFGAVDQRLDVVYRGEVEFFGEIDIAAFDLVGVGVEGVGAWVEFVFDGALQFFIVETVAIAEDLGKVGTKGAFGVDVVEDVDRVREDLAEFEGDLIETLHIEVAKVFVEEVECLGNERIAIAVSESHPQRTHKARKTEASAFCFSQ